MKVNEIDLATLVYQSL